MSEIIIGLVAIVAIAFIFETVKRGGGAHSSGGEDDDDYVSADEAGPTQSGRFRAQRVKAAIQKARQDTKQPEAKSSPKQEARHSTKGTPPKQRDAGMHRSMAHEKVDDDSSTDLPDPFEIDLREEDS